MKTNYIKEIEFLSAAKVQNIEWRSLNENKDYVILEKPLRIGGISIDVLCYEKNKNRYRIVSIRGTGKGSDYSNFDVYGLNTESGTKNILLHRARLKAFRGEPPTDKPKCLHIDGNARNNDLTNLRWGSHRENMADLAKHGSLRGINNASAKINEEMALSLYVLSQLELVCPEILAELHITAAQVSAIKARRAWRHVSTDEVTKLVCLAKDFMGRKIEKAVEEETLKMRRRYTNEVKAMKSKVKQKINDLLIDL